MVSRPVHSCITIKILDLCVLTIIVWIVMHKITCLKDEILDILYTKYIQCPIIKIAAVSIIENHLGV